MWLFIDVDQVLGEGVRFGNGKVVVLVVVVGSVGFQLQGWLWLVYVFWIYLLSICNKQEYILQ